VIGQSGGGMKVSNLLVMPSANGFFHRACIQSGPGRKTASGSAPLKQPLQCSQNWGSLRRPLIDGRQFRLKDCLMRATAATKENHSTTAIDAGPRSGELPRVGFAPYVDGNVIPRNPFDPDTQTISAQVPILIGSVFNEFVTGLEKPGCTTPRQFALHPYRAHLFEPIRSASRHTTPRRRMPRGTDRGNSRSRYVFNALRHRAAFTAEPLPHTAAA
jgi:hypothetical protein